MRGARCKSSWGKLDRGCAKDRPHPFPAAPFLRRRIFRRMGTSVSPPGRLRRRLSGRPSAPRSAADSAGKVRRSGCTRSPQSFRSGVEHAVPGPPLDRTCPRLRARRGRRLHRPEPRGRARAEARLVAGRRIAARGAGAGAGAGTAAPAPPARRGAAHHPRHLRKLVRHRQPGQARGAAGPGRHHGDQRLRGGRQGRGRRALPQPGGGRAAGGARAQHPRARPQGGGRHAAGARHPPHRPRRGLQGPAAVAPQAGVVHPQSGRLASGATGRGSAG